MLISSLVELLPLALLAVSPSDSSCVAQLIHIVMLTLSSSIVCLWYWLHAIQNDPPESGIHFLYFSLSASSGLFLFKVSGGFSTKYELSWWKPVSQSFVLHFVLKLLLSRIQTFVKLLPHVEQLGKSLFRKMWGDLLPDRSIGTVKRISNSVALDGCLNCTNLEGDATVHRYTWMLYAYVSGWRNISYLYWFSETYFRSLANLFLLHPNT